MEKHLDVYVNRYELYEGTKKTVFYQGFQSKKAQDRYKKIIEAFKDEYLDKKYLNLQSVDFSNLSDENRVLIQQMVDGITSEVGRALVGLTCLQLAIKSIAPTQSIRLHKGSTTRGRFSWVDGISMRTLDRYFNTPFLRRYGLLKVNRDGVFMTRSLAENYPYSMLYKAEMRGPFDQWIAIVDAIENGSMPSDLALSYLLVLLKNRSDAFKENAERACSLTCHYNERTFNEILDLIVNFFSNTDYSARAFEVVLHCFYQAISELGYLGDTEIVPISQMRSANKKHGNVGDIELTENGTIFKSWDAKYGKPYLRDELEELRDKLLSHRDVKVAGFVCDDKVDLRRDIKKRVEEIEIETDTEIHLFSFNEWLEYELKLYIPEEKKDELARKWLVAIVESFAQKRPLLAPIEEPCDAWINDLIGLMREAEKPKDM